MSTSDQIIIYGKAVKGLRESSSFTEIPWVRGQFISKLGFTPYPGTFNLEVKEETSLKKLKKVKEGRGIEILPMESGFCSARCYHVLVGDKIEGVMVIPEVTGYPDSKLEIIAPCNIKDELEISDGDLVKVEIIVGKKE